MVSLSFLVLQGKEQEGTVIAFTIQRLKRWIIMYQVDRLVLTGRETFKTQLLEVISITLQVHAVCCMLLYFYYAFTTIHTL